MQQYVQNIVKDIKEKMTHDEIKEYFDNKCYFSKDDFGEVISEFMIKNNHTILKIILKSKKFTECNDCINEYGEPVIQAILYTIQAVYSSEEIANDRKRYFKESLLSILFDESINFNWNIVDRNNENPLHVILAMQEYFSYSEIYKLVNLAINNGVNPLNKNCVDDNSFDVIFNLDYSNVERNTLIKKMASVVDNFMIEVKSEAYN